MMRKHLSAAAIAILCVSTAATVDARGGGGGPRGGGGGPGPRGNFGGESRGQFGDGRGGNVRSGAEFGNRGIENGIGRDAGPRSQVIHPEADANRAPSRDNLQRFLGLPAGGDAGRAGDHPGSQIVNGRPNKAGDTARQNAQRDARHNEINRQLANRHDDFNRWFNHRWWGAPGWGALAAWGAWGWGAPYAYNYGDDVYYSDNTVYSDGEPIATSDEYAQQASDIAQNGADADTTQGDWMPLGVFALSADDAKGAAPSTFVQLAVSKDGVIAGTSVNAARDEKQSVEGSVDRKSQRAAWTVAGQKWPVYEAGIYNLTEKTVPILVHYSDGQTQQQLLVRVDKPDGSEKADASASASADTQ